jgi:YHS domain-containing protein
MMAGAAVVGVNADDAKTDGAKKAVTNKMCPVMNAPVSEKYRTEYNGQYVYFCCQGCVTMFEKEPAKYIAELSKEDLAAIQPNEICPITNEKNPNMSLWVEHEGRKVYFCCDGCVNMFKKKIAAKKAE